METLSRTELVICTGVCCFSCGHIEGVFVFWVRKTLEYLRAERLPLTHRLTEHKDERATYTPLCLMVTSVSRLAYLTSDSETLRGRFDGLYLSSECPQALLFLSALGCLRVRGHEE